MTDPDSSATVRFSTADLPENMRVATWREQYAHTVLRADIQHDDDASFEATVASRALPGLKLMAGRFTAARLLRTREMTGDGNDDLYLFVNRTGDVTVSARGRDVTLGENDALLISSGEAAVLDRRTLGESITTRIPYSMLSPMVVDVDDAIMRRIPSNTAALKLLTGYANALLGEDHAMTTPAHRHRVATHVHDLAALTLGATLEAADVGDGEVQFPASVSKTKVGWTAGAGAEWMFARNWSAKLEYLYVDLGSESAIGDVTAIEIINPPVPRVGYTWHTRENIARVGVNYHFN